uniref:Uncharacterized protein n=1 Tax=Anguilla anguilla TaxID=7936 RepID=A0A0E9VVR5_ANGAN
MHTLYLLNW